jgi:hypothetical protein
VDDVTSRIRDEKLRYTVHEPGKPDVLQDCSGIFHRLLDTGMWAVGAA